MIQAQVLNKILQNKDSSIITLNNLTVDYFSDYVEEFRKEMQLEDDKFVLRLTSEETSKFTIDTHLYEIEYTLVGGAINTPNQWKFDILDQIIE